MTHSGSAAWLPRALALAGLAILALLLLSGIAAVVALAGLGRLTADVDPFAVGPWLWYYRADADVRRWIAIGSLSASGFTLIVGVTLFRPRQPPLHGAARWASEADLRRAGLRAKSGIVLGHKGGRPLVFGGSEHALLYAPTRTGKGVGVVIPNLLTWPGSVVVLDVKRENWTASSGFRAAHGQEVILFDPLDPQGRTARYNPLGHVDRKDPQGVVEELQKLSVMLFPSPPNADPFWSEAARVGFIGIGAYVAETPELPLSIGAIFAELTSGAPRTRFPELVVARAAQGRPLSGECARALLDFCSTSEATFASVKQTISSRLSLWLSPRARAATEASDFDLRDLRSRRISLYLGVSPDNLARVAPLYALLLQQLIEMNTRELPTNEKHTIQVLVLLDEFARLGHASIIAHAFSYVAGYGLRLLPVLQSPAQLRAEYGPHLAEDIIANCAVEVAFTPKDLKTAQDLSERLGYWTYKASSRSKPHGLSGGRRSTTESAQRRALMLPQELLQMPPDQLILLRAGARPVRARKLVYWREGVLMRRIMPPPEVKPLTLKAMPAPEPAQPSPAAGDEPPAGRPIDLVLSNLAAKGLAPAAAAPPAPGPATELSRAADRPRPGQTPRRER